MLASVSGNAVPLRGGMGIAVRCGLAIFTETNKHNVIHREDGLLGNHVPNLSTHGDGCGAELSSHQTHLDEVAFNGRSNKVDFGDDLSHHSTIT